MRTDVKLGIGLSMALVLVVGAYFTFGGEKKPIPVTDQVSPATTAAKAANPADTPDKKALATKPQRNTNPRTTQGPMDASTRLAANDGSRPASPASAPANRPEPTFSPNPALSTDRASQPASPMQAPAGPGESPSHWRTGSPANRAGTPDVPIRTHVASSSPSQPSHQPNPAGPALPLMDAGATRDSTQAAVDIHRAQPGDTLVSIAQAYYGSATYIPLLRQANPEIADPTRLTPGAAIRIPPAPAGGYKLASSTPPGNSPATRASSPAEGAGSGVKRTYTVQSGDSFYRIAEKQLGNANRWRELLKLNSDLVKGDPTRLRPGQVVVLP